MEHRLRHKINCVQQTVITMLENQTEIIGSWIYINMQVVMDDNCNLIHKLITEKLVYLADDESGWNKLYKDEIDNSLWELTYPKSDLEGGGPFKLSKVHRNKTIEQKYSLTQ